MMLFEKKIAKSLITLKGLKTNCEINNFQKVVCDGTEVNFNVIVRTKSSNPCVEMIEVNT